MSYQSNPTQLRVTLLKSVSLLIDDVKKPVKLVKLSLTEDQSDLLSVKARGLLEEMLLLVQHRVCSQQVSQV